MNVIPQFPVHDPYIQSPYSEMRFLRFGDFFLSTALLFSLAEACSFPHFSAIKDKAETEVNSMYWGDRGKKELMILSLNKETNTNQIIIAWILWNQGWIRQYSWSAYNWWV